MLVLIIQREIFRLRITWVSTPHWAFAILSSIKVSCWLNLELIFKGLISSLDPTDDVHPRKPHVIEIVPSRPDQYQLPEFDIEFGESSWESPRRHHFHTNKWKNYRTYSNLSSLLGPSSERQINIHSTDPAPVRSWNPIWSMWENKKATSREKRVPT
jgi:hypothetical protein